MPWCPATAREDVYEGIDVSGKVALVQRGGGMYYEQKERSAYAHGAIAMLVYNNVPGMLYMSITDWKMPCAFISQEAGEYLKAQENKVLTVGARRQAGGFPHLWYGGLLLLGRHHGADPEAGDHCARRRHLCRRTRQRL